MVLLFSEEESSLLEFKREYPRNDQIIKTVIGFANQNGGRIIIGVTDDRTIVGVQEKIVQEMMEKIQNLIYDTCYPTIIPSLYTRRFEDKLVLVIDVSRGNNSKRSRSC